MKKRLLITSIVMMLVVAVALSTATYAWFTSNTSVSASVMTLKAASSDASSLGIGWTGKTAQSAIVSPIYTTLEPMAPMDTDGTNVRALKNGTSTYEISDSNIQFYTSTVKELNSVISFNNAYTAEGANKQPVVYTEKSTEATNGSGYTQANSFYIKNLSKANTISSVTVSGLFPGSGEGEVKYAIVTEAAPIQNKRYFNYTNGQYVEIVDTIQTPNDDTSDNYRTYLQTNGFLSNQTYYEIAYTFIQTKDTKMNKDTNYYQFTTKTFTTEDQYVASKYYKVNADGLYILADEDAADSQTTYYAKTIIPYNSEASAINESTSPYYYEQLSGDDMIRVALYTKRYTAVKAGDTKVDGTKYYKYDASTGIMDIGTLGSSITGLTNNKFTGNEGYYTADANHKLLGVLGNAATELALATSFDINDTYFTVASTSDNVTEWNYFNYFVLDNGKYVKATEFTNTTYYEVTQFSTTESDVYKVVTDPSEQNLGNYYTKDTTETKYNKYTSAASTTFDNSKTYYTKTNNKVNNKVVNSSKTNLADGEYKFAANTYYTAKNTVVNGQITVNGAVKDMNYYTDVVPSITFAEKLAPGEQVDIIAVVWLDGTMLDDTRAGELAQVSLLFNANDKVIGE